MINDTSRSGIQAVMFLVLRSGEEPVPPRYIAECLGQSPSYLAKIAQSLVKADILRSTRGAKGGVTLSRSPQAISLLQIVEACQGKILAGFCEEAPDLRQVCAFHRAMARIHDAITDTLSGWSVADLVARPGPSEAIAEKVDCSMSCTLAGKN